MPDDRETVPPLDGCPCCETTAPPVFLVHRTPGTVQHACQACGCRGPHGATLAESARRWNKIPRRFLKLTENDARAIYEELCDVVSSPDVDAFGIVGEVSQGIGWSMLDDRTREAFRLLASKLAARRGL